MTDTPNLSLPLIAPSQAQKHVTHNESILMLDSLVQLSVVSKDQTTPPGAPANGARYILPTGATGAWSGQDGSLAIWRESIWEFYTAQEGWTAWLADLDQSWTFDGSLWVKTTPPEDFQNLDLVGINTTADLTNRLSVTSPAVLFNNESGSIQAKLNKAADTDTASFLFQTGWSGRAELGLTGDDDFHLKVSPDGSTWYDGIILDRTNGHLSVAGISGRIEVSNTGQSVFIGQGAGANDDLSLNNNVFVGYLSGQANISGANNSATGAESLTANTTGGFNSAAGVRTLFSNTTGTSNSALGMNALFGNTVGANNCGIGVNTLYANTVGGSNSAIGVNSLGTNTGGSNNSAFGVNSLYANLTGNYNSAAGMNALRYRTAGTNNTTYSNCAGLGYDTRVSGSDQVQLGNSLTTTYAYGAVQDRSDVRDKTDIRDTKLGLSFINNLRPVDFRWDMRDYYFDLTETTNPETGQMTSDLISVEKDGSRKRGRFHHGLIAQEVAEVVHKAGIDFGGYQDHSYNGGDDVLSIGYTELIGPLIKAVQELSARLEVLEGQ